jgi:hypothetical protein
MGFATMKKSEWQSNSVNYISPQRGFMHGLSTAWLVTALHG